MLTCVSVSPMSGKARHSDDFARQLGVFWGNRDGEKRSARVSVMDPSGFYYNCNAEHTDGAKSSDLPASTLLFCAIKKVFKGAMSPFLCPLVALRI